MRPEVELLLERLMESGEAVEAVCAGHPELLDEVRARWRRLQDVRDRVDELFPAGLSAPDAAASEPPRIEGYELEGVVGRGGMGIVYRARQISLGRRVAIKVLHDVHVGPTALARFRREAELVAQLQHPHIVEVHEVGAGRRPCIVMELLEGGSLAGRLRRSPMPARAAAEMMVVLAGASDAAHRAGILHRDLKPTNVLLTADGHAKIADFGLARRLDDDAGLTLSGAQIGTPSYMSPEQARGDAAIGVGADVYSLGAMLYEMLTGRPPFRADTATETLRQVLDEEPARPSRLNARVPRDLETICLRCLHKQARQRYASAAELAADLGRYLRDEAILARPAGPLERSSRWLRRHPARAASIAFGLATGLLVGGAWIWLASRQAAVNAMIEGDLADVKRFERLADWSAAEGALRRARLAGAHGVPPALAARITRAAGELQLVRRLEGIALDRATGGGADFGRVRSDRAFAEAFADGGVGVIAGSAAAFGSKVAASDVRIALLDALDAWAFCTFDPARREWLLDAARAADPDPTWRDRVRTAAVWQDTEALTQLAEACDEKVQPLHLQLMVGGLLEARQRDALPFYRRTYLASPNDFWVNMVLGQCLAERGDPEGAGFFRVAMSLRPDAAAPVVNLAIELQKQGREGEALACWQRALELAPRSVMVLRNVAAARLNRGQAREGERLLRQLLAEAGDEPAIEARTWLARAILAQGRAAEALTLVEGALANSDLAAEARRNLEDLAVACRRQRVVEARLEEVLRGDDSPLDAAEELEFAQLLRQQGRDREALHHFRESFAHDAARAADPQQQHRFDAARVAIRVALAPKEGDDAVALWGMALDWLASELADCTQYLAQDAGNGAALAPYLRQWLHDAEFVRLRDPVVTAGLPSAVQQRCAALWESATALAERASARR